MRAGTAPVRCRRATARCPARAAAAELAAAAAATTCTRRRRARGRRAGEQVFAPAAAARACSFTLAMRPFSLLLVTGVNGRDATHLALAATDFTLYEALHERTAAGGAGAGVDAAAAGDAVAAAAGGGDAVPRRAPFAL